MSSLVESKPSTTSAGSSAAAQPPSANPNVGCRLPDSTTLSNACKWAILDDRPIMMDYWYGSINKEVLIGVREDGTKLLVRSQDEYTSPIQKIMKNNQDFIIVTENSIYIVSADIPVKKIT
jgi:hypothetical protein